MEISLQLNRDDLVVINNALNELCNGNYGPEDWEFQTLVSVTRDEARLVLAKITSVLDSNPPVA